MKTMSIVLLLFSFIIFGCGMPMRGMPMRGMPMQTPDTSAQYRITFIGTWSAATHPDFPPGPFDSRSAEPHFTTIIGTTHNSSYTLWATDQMASEGVERVAETGLVPVLQQELGAAEMAGGAQTRVTISGGVFDLPNTTESEPFTVNRSHPLLSLVTMIAPSPDWFTGINSFSLLNDENEWIDNAIRILYPYNAGTEGVPLESNMHELDCPLVDPTMPQSGSNPRTDCDNNRDLKAAGQTQLNIQRITMANGFSTSNPLITANADSNGATRVGYLVITRVR